MTVNALDVKITIYEMEKMFNSHKEGIIAYHEAFNKLSGNEQKKNNLIKIIEFETLEEFTKASMKNLATVSHGDIVLIENGKEIKRVKGNYKDLKSYNAD